MKAWYKKIGRRDIIWLFHIIDKFLSLYKSQSQLLWGEIEFGEKHKQNKSLWFFYWENVTQEGNLRMWLLVVVLMFYFWVHDIFLRPRPLDSVISFMCQCCHFQYFRIRSCSFRKINQMFNYITLLQFHTCLHRGENYPSSIHETKENNQQIFWADHEESTEYSIKETTTKTWADEESTEFNQRIQLQEFELMMKNLVIFNQRNNKTLSWWWRIYWIFNLRNDKQESELMLKDLLNIQSKKQPPKLEQVMQNQLKLNQRDNHQELSWSKWWIYQIQWILIFLKRVTTIVMSNVPDGMFFGLKSSLVGEWDLGLEMLLADGKFFTQRVSGVECGRKRSRRRKG